MIQTAPSPQHIRDLFKQSLEAVMPDTASKASIERLLAYITTVIKNQSFQDEGGNRVSISSGAAISVARSIFEAKKNTGEAKNQEMLKGAIDLLDKAFSGLGDKFEALQITLKASDEVLSSIEKSLSQFKPSKKASTEGQSQDAKPSPDPTELKLINRLIEEAQFYAVDTKSGKLDQSLFEKNLVKSLKQHRNKLSDNTQRYILAEVKNTRLHASAFSAFGVLPQLMNIAKTLVPDIENKALQEQFAKGDFSEITIEERQVVAKLLEDTVSAYGTNCKTMDPEAALKKALGKTEPLKKLEALNDKQKIFFNHLVLKYKDLKSSEPNEWIAKLTESLPNLIVPSIIGAVLAYVFGFSANLGAMGAAAMSFLGSLANNSGAPGAQVQAKSKPPKPEQIENLQSAA